MDTEGCDKGEGGGGRCYFRLGGQKRLLQRGDIWKETQMTTASQTWKETRQNFLGTAGTKALRLLSIWH